MLRNTFPVSVLAPFPESGLGFVRLDIGFWGWVLWIGAVGAARGGLGGWLAGLGGNWGRGGEFGGI